MMAQLHDRLTAFLLNLEVQGPEGRIDAIANEALETGGTYVPRPSGDTWASPFHEINLHDISATGATAEEAIRNWTKAAHRQCNGMSSLKSTVPPTPFPTPRNHHEEIANLRAAMGRV